MTKRPLTEEEERLTRRALEEMQTRERYNLFRIKEKTLLLDEGLAVLFEEKRREVERDIRNLRAELPEITFSIETCEDTLTNGVEVKENDNDGE